MDNETMTPAATCPIPSPCRRPGPPARRPAPSLKTAGARQKPLLMLLGALLTLALAFSTIAAAETYVGADILIDTTWTKSGSPYIVTQDIYIGARSNFEVASLKIEPGVVVRFNPGCGFKVGFLDDYGWLALNGRLEVRGAPGEAVLFTSNSASPSPGD